MRFTITRSKWYRGKLNGSKLLRECDGMQCCMGQMASQAGIDDAALVDRGAFSWLHQADKATLGDAGLFNCAADEEPEWVNSAYLVNDSGDIDDATREAKLTALAATAGHELVFFD